MVELYPLDDVDQACDFSMMQPERVVVTPGRNSNDLMAASISARHRYICPVTFLDARVKLAWQEKPEVPDDPTPVRLTPFASHLRPAARCKGLSILGRTCDRFRHVPIPTSTSSKK